MWVEFMKMLKTSYSSKKKKKKKKVKTCYTDLMEDGPR